MKAEKININELKKYIDVAFKDDDEIVSFYDRNKNIKTVNDCCEDIYNKIFSLHENCELRAIISDDNLEVGYFVFQDFSLLSFAININYRNKLNLIDFFNIIKSEIGTDFQCCLFGHNTRAIEWLKKSGMNIIFENVTILQLCH